MFRKSTDDDSNPSLNRMSEHVSRPLTRLLWKSLAWWTRGPAKIDNANQEVSMAIMIMMIFRKKGILVMRKMEGIKFTASSP